jgi:hypothetical protein
LFFLVSQAWRAFNLALVTHSDIQNFSVFLLHPPKKIQEPPPQHPNRSLNPAEIPSQKPSTNMSSASGSRPADGALPIRTKEQKQPTKPAAANVAPKPNTSENTDASINSLVSAAEEQVAKSRPGYKTHRRRERKKRLKALFRDEEGKKPQEMPPQDESMAKSRRTKPRAEKKSGDDQAEKAAAGDDKAVAARGSRAAKPQAEKTGGGFIIEKRHGAPSWKLSPFLGGRYAPLDPVFTKDEKYASSVPQLRHSIDGSPQASTCSSGALVEGLLCQNLSTSPRDIPPCHRPDRAHHFLFPRFKNRRPRLCRIKLVVVPVQFDER